MPAIIHLLHAAEKGKIFSGETPELPGKPAGNFSVACDPNSPLPKHATDWAEAVTCPLCKKTSVYEEIRQKQTPGVSADKAAAAALEEQNAAEESGGDEQHE